MAADPTRDAGRFTTAYGNVELYSVVRQVLEQAGVPEGETVSTRRFDTLSAECGIEGVPSARQIGQRLKRPWREVVDIARGADGAPSPTRAVISVERSVENSDLGERHVVFALATVARHLGLSTLRPGEYERGVASLLEAGGREAARRIKDLMPTEGQIVRIAGDWDVALAMAGLDARPGVTLTAVGQKEVERVRALATATGPLPAKKRAKPLRGRKGTAPTRPRRTKTETPEPTAETAEEAKPLTQGRAKAGSQAHAIELPDAIVAFARTQNGWPANHHAMRTWQKTFRISVRTPRPLDWPAALASAHAAADDDAPARDRTIRANDIDATKTPPASLPRQYTVEWTREECLDAIDRFLDTLGPNDRPTQQAYRNWRKTTAPDAPNAGVFPRHGGQVALVNEAKQRRRKLARRQKS